MKELNGTINVSASEELVNLCNAISSLPGIEIICTSCHIPGGDVGIHIWFKVSDIWDRKEGLFFLTRCSDHRYWQYGHLWEINLSVGDQYDGLDLPTHYCLSSKNTIGDEAIIHANDLVENLNHHLNHENFMGGYDIDVEEFDYREVFEIN